MHTLWCLDLCQDCWYAIGVEEYRVLRIQWMILVRLDASPEFISTLTLTRERVQCLIHVLLGSACGSRTISSNTSSIDPKHDETDRDVDLANVFNTFRWTPVTQPSQDKPCFHPEQTGICVRTISPDESAQEVRRRASNQAPGAGGVVKMHKQYGSTCIIIRFLLPLQIYKESVP